jgi:hypothetical protein
MFNTTDRSSFTYADGLFEFLRINRLQNRHNNPQQLLRVLEGLYVKVDSAAFRVESVELPPANVTRGQRRDRGGRLWANRSLCSNSLPLGWIDTIGRLRRCWSFAVRLVKDFKACSMYAL